MAVKLDVEHLRGLVEPILHSLGYDLVDLAYAGHGGKGALRIFIDKEGGITLEDCVQASRFISHALDVEDPISHSYQLEVSSPGLDRPLKYLEDFQRYQGRMVKVKIHSPMENQSVLQGRLVGQEGDQIHIVLEGRKKAIVPFQHILSAKLQLEF